MAKLGPDHSKRRGTQLLLGALAALTLLALTATPAFAHGSYSQAPFQEWTNSYTFGQAPVFMPDGKVVFGQDYDNGHGTQVYMANRNGSDLRCLTCELPPPNNVPAVQPGGKWILFHSWMGHHLTLGSPGYGGIGSELYAMRPNGTDVTKLYSDPTVEDGEGTDDYHAYWSPNGQRIVWTHFNGNFINGGGEARWDIRVASFVVRDGRPALTDVRVVRPANGHWYETQWWAPDNSGFLYTETWGTATNTELFFCKLPKTGPCHTTQLTDYPAWNEQALFTPDMKDVIFMSSRDRPGFLNTWIQLAQDIGLTTSGDNLLILPIFELGFLQPIAPEATDLYELDLETHAVRRLTTDGNDGWVTPEFTWDPNRRELFWTENRLPPGLRVTLPLNLVNQIKETLSYLEHPDLSLPSEGVMGNLLQTVLPVQQITRVARFPGTCVPPAKLRYHLTSSSGARIIGVRVRLNGTTVRSRRGHDLERVSLTTPMEQTFTVSVSEIESTGRRIAFARAYSGMGCYSRRIAR